MPDLSKGEGNPSVAPWNADTLNPIRLSVGYIVLPFISGSACHDEKGSGRQVHSPLLFSFSHFHNTSTSQWQRHYRTCTCRLLTLRGSKLFKGQRLECFAKGFEIIRASKSLISQIQSTIKLEEAVWISAFIGQVEFSKKVRFACESWMCVDVRSQAYSRRILIDCQLIYSCNLFQIDQLIDHWSCCCRDCLYSFPKASCLQSKLQDEWAEISKWEREPCT